jgi:hypothetical protein
MRRRLRDKGSSHLPAYIVRNRFGHKTEKKLVGSIMISLLGDRLAGGSVICVYIRNSLAVLLRIAQTLAGTIVSLTISGVSGASGNISVPFLNSPGSISKRII